MKWSKKLLLWGFIPLMVLACAGAAYHWLATLRAEREYPMPGELVDIGSHRMHIHKRGSGSPTVVIDTGLSAASWEYETVADGIAPFTTVCTYDRAGYGWSDPGPRPRSSQQAVAELRLLIQTAQLKPPYILVGHSWGGVNVRLYASLSPDDVAGLVLLDSLNWDAFPEKHKAGQLPFLYDVLDSTAFLGTARLALPFIFPPLSNADPSWQKKKFATMSRTKTLHAIHDELAGQTNWLTVRAATKHLGDKPVIVISRRVEERDPKSDQFWFKSQQALTNISNNCKFLVARSKDHGNIEPSITIEAVKELVEGFRSQKRSP